MRKLLILVCIFVLGFASPNEAGNIFKVRSNLTGGTSSVDNIPYAILNDGDICLTVTSGNILYLHRFESSSSASESSPDVIVPDDRSGLGSWELVSAMRSVGACTDDSCLDGSSDGGTYLRLYDGDSHYLEINPGNMLKTGL